MNTSSSLNSRQRQLELRPLITNHVPHTHQEAPRANSLPLPGEMGRSPTSGNSFPSSPSLKQCPCVIDPSCQTQLNKRCGKDCVRLCIFNYPDYVKWHEPTEKVSIERDSTGKLGFKLYQKESKKHIGEKYTLVHSVIEGSKAVGKLVFGDSILSVNGTPLRNKSLAEVVKESKDNVITIIINRPMGLIPIQPFQRSTSVPSSSPGSHRRTLDDQHVSSESHDSLNSEHVLLNRTGSRKSSGTSSNSGSSCTPTSPSSPDVNIHINYVIPSESRARNMPILNENSSNRSESSDLGPELHRHQVAAVEGEVAKILAADMPFLPRLKLIILGSKSDEIAKSLVPRSVSSQSDNLVCTKYHTCLAKKEQFCEWLPNKGSITIQPIMKAVTKAVRESLGIDLTESTLTSSNTSERFGLILQRISQNGYMSLEDYEEVELEVLAVKETPLSMYCRHVLYTAHSIYVIQFDVNDYYEDREAVLMYIQTELSKIRTYSSDRVQIVLVATTSSQLCSRDMNRIGQTLQEYFSGAFANQLHPNAENNLPCYFLHPSNQQNDLDLGCFNRQESCEDNTAPKHAATPDSRAEIKCGCERSKVNVNGGNQIQHNADYEKAFNVHDLKSQINVMAFQQRFATRKYPYRYLLYQEQKENVRHSHPVGAQMSHILRECGIEDEAEKNTLLKFLHDSGDIICMKHLPYMMSYKLHLLNFMDMVLFSRDHLINAMQRLLTIPTRSSQVPEHRTHWDELYKEAMVRRSFLLDLLGSDHQLLEIFLDMMNLIFCMDDTHTNKRRNGEEEYAQHESRHNDGGPMEVQQSTASSQYIVPFFKSNQLQNAEDEDEPHCNSGDRILYLDFRGFIPHGAFMRIMIQLIGRSEQERGTWDIGSQFSGWVTFAKHATDFDCKLELELDPLAATIKISALCQTSYSPQIIPRLLRQRIMKRLKPTNNIIVYKCGPPCPRFPACQSGQNKHRIHVLDLKDGKGPLWCGQEQVDREQSVNQWLDTEDTGVHDSSILDDDSDELPIVRKSSHIKKLPHSMYLWICTHLNHSCTIGHSWEMVADVLGYTTSDVLIWRQRQRRVTDPCDSFLEDWGRYSTATLGKLMQCLDRIQREDMLEDMHLFWKIVN